MKRTFLMALALTLLSCSDGEKQFEEVPCGLKESYTNSNKRKIYKPCREYIYQARYWDRNYNLISEERIWMMATGKEWGYDPNTQDEVAIQYEVNQEKQGFIQQFNINPEFEHPWKEGEVTGVVENDTETWMHPFRSNQYIFTEVVAFPMVKLPIERGNQWTSGLNIYEGWGRWENTTLSSTYRVLDFEVTDTPFGQLSAWHVKAVTEASFGTSVHDFWYHEDYGFIKMTVVNYEGQVLTIELSEINE